MIEGIVHSLAFHYHWSKIEILNCVYLDEALFYMQEIKKARLRDLITQIAITASPNLKTENYKDFVGGFQKELKKLENQYNIDSDDMPEAGVFDKLRTIMNRPKFKK